MLHILAGIDRPTSGKVYVDGEDIYAKSEKELAYYRRRKAGLIYQFYNLVPTLTVEENITLPCRLDKKKTDKETLGRLLDTLGMTERRNHLPSQLSGGQRQRVAFARALAPNPQLLLLDEPFAAIDAKVRQELRSWLKEMIEKLGVTSIFVTHDQDEAIEVADEIIITNHGKIEKKGSPIEIYQKPQTAFTASFFGQASFVDDYSKFSTFKKIDGADKAIIRPEFLDVTKKNENQKYKSSAAEGVVERVAFRGDNTELTISVNGTKLTAKRTLNEAEVRVGEKVDVFVYKIFVTKGNSVYILDNEAINEDSFII